MIRGKKINLRFVRETDLKELFEFQTNLEIRGDYFPLIITPEPVFLKKFMDFGFWDENYGRLLLVDEKDKILGTIWYSKNNSYLSALEIGYILYDPMQRGKGMMTEALKLFGEYIFSIKQINRLEIRVLPGNIASEKVAQKAGYQFEGITRECFFHKGKFLDLKNYALLRSEFEEKFS
jgi:[ribosomal protein S5]-alanine N-acetyltransferase